MNVDRMPKTNQRGFTIIELALAIVIMAIAMGAVALALGSTLRHGKNSTGRTVGAGIVTEEMETVRQLARTDFISLPLGLVERDTSIDGVTYHVLRESEFVSEASTEDVCSDTSSGSGASPSFLRVRVIVTWPGVDTDHAANAETLLSPPVGAFDPTKGHIAVQVRRGDASGTSGVTATLLSGATVVRTLTTTTDGCAFFAYVNPGSYTVRLSRSNYVDGQNDPLPTRSVTVAAATSVATSFDFDEQGKLSGPRFDVSGTGAPLPIGAGATIAHTSLTPAGRKSFAFAGASSASQTIAAFPYAEGYQVWGGACADADPGTVYRPAAFTVAAGVTNSTVQYGVTSQEFKVEVPAGHGTPYFSEGPVSGVRLKLTHDPMTGCESGEVLTWDTWVDTASDGTVRVALPLGTWTVEVLGYKPGPGTWGAVGGTWPQITIGGDPEDASRPTVTIEVE